ncbi:MAG: hypothetical protein HWN67_03475, partial [Candidatus Helarchaeota archaeon]|nr:hypothetical protein [Candidatus Helarchaeota archaeon]
MLPKTTTSMPCGQHLTFLCQLSQVILLPVRTVFGKDDHSSVYYYLKTYLNETDLMKNEKT